MLRRERFRSELRKVSGRVSGRTWILDELGEGPRELGTGLVEPAFRFRRKIPSSKVSEISTLDPVPHAAEPKEPTIMLSFSSKRSSSDRIRQRTQRKSKLGVEAMEGRQLMTSGIVISLPPLPADLNVVSLNVQNLANNQVRLTATLENGGASPIRFLPGTTYPGGGLFEISRSSGGTILYGPPTSQGTPTPQADPDPGSVIASMAIPSIPYGSTIQLSTVTTGRAIFTAAAVPRLPVFALNAAKVSRPWPRCRSSVSSTLGVKYGPLPEVNPANDTLTVDDLIPTSLPINTTTMNLIPQIQNAVANTKYRAERK